jgi:hypothetical protein
MTKYCPHRPGPPAEPRPTCPIRRCGEVSTRRVLFLRSPLLFSHYILASWPVGCLSLSMPLHSQSALLRRSSRQFSQYTTTQLRYASGGPTAQVEVTPSQVLRFSLTGKTQPSTEHVKPKPGRDIGHIFDRWDLGTPPPPELGLLKRRRFRSSESMPLKRLRTNTRAIRYVQVFIERSVFDAPSGMFIQVNGCGSLRRALQRCERHNSYSEILCAINGLVARLEDLRSPVSTCLYVLGMHYACLSLSPPALYHHLEGYRHVSSEPLSFDTSVSLVSSLFRTLKKVQFGDPGFSTLPMLKLVTGEGGGASDACRLHDALFWADPNGSTSSVHQYILLLTKLKSRTVLQQVLDQSLQDISPNSIFPIKRAYDCVMGLMDEGESEQAATYLKQISERCHDTLPGISKFHGLRRLLADEKTSELLPKIAGDLEYADMLQNQLYDMETRLGIKWQSQKSIHTSIADPQCVASEEPLLTTDGDCAGFDSVERFTAEIQTFGCSSEPGELGRIADLLNEHDGTEIPVTTISTFEAGSSELAWLPQCSPIEFSSAPIPSRHDCSAPWSPSTLGLLRGRIDCGVPLENERPLHLMQLGYLVMLQQAPMLHARAKADDGHYWKETGHIVAWDRVGGQLLAVFVGKGHGLIEPGLPPPSLKPPPGLGRVEGITVPGHKLGRRTGAAIRYSKFHFDVDSL